jgi:DNA-binding MurR/RpiR family transcriptional regulator
VVTEPEVTVAERLKLRNDLTPAERKVARVLLAQYPVGGLEPIAKLAADAGVSPPTVVRLVSKLGFDSYAGFQASLKSEVTARLSSPLSMHAGLGDTVLGDTVLGDTVLGDTVLGDTVLGDTVLGDTVLGDTAPADVGDVLARSERVLCGGISASFARLPRAEFDEAVGLLADERRGAVLIGGRFSSMLAEYLAAHLRILRPHVRVISSAGADRISSLLDVGRRDVLVAFDYRRYQHDTVRLALTAKQQGATLIAFTDPYLSPLSAHADVVLTSSVASPSPFDALTPAVALIETVIAALVDRLGVAPLARMARYDALFAGTVEQEVP